MVVVVEETWPTGRAQGEKAEESQTDRPTWHEVCGLRLIVRYYIICTTLPLASLFATINMMTLRATTLLIHLLVLICLNVALSLIAAVPPIHRVGATFSNPTDDDESTKSLLSDPITSFLLRISYDGTRFTGWSAANDDNSNGEMLISSKVRRRRRRRRGSLVALPPGQVRSVQGVLRQNLAKLYGNVDPKRIVLDGSSRTDKGVRTKKTSAVFCILIL